MSGRLEVISWPQRYHVWLTAATEGLTEDQRKLVSAHLKSLPGWIAGLFGEDRVSTTYAAYATTRDEAVMAAVEVLRWVGVEVPEVGAHTTWRVKFGLTRPMVDDSDPAFPHLSVGGVKLGQRIRQESWVFEANFNCPEFDTLIVDIQGELTPDPGQLAAIMLLIREAETQ